MVLLMQLPGSFFADTASALTVITLNDSASEQIECNRLWTQSFEMHDHYKDFILCTGLTKVV